MGEDFSVVSVILAATAGAFLGMVVIPLRKQMIEFERLRFRSGIAVASLLKSPGAGARQAKLLIGGFAVSAAIHLCTGLGVFAEEINFGGMMGAPSWVSLSIAISFASLGAGLLSGRGGLPFVFGACSRGGSSRRWRSRWGSSPPLPRCGACWREQPTTTGSPGRSSTDRCCVRSASGC